MNLIQSLTRRPTEQRFNALALDDWASLFSPWNIGGRLQTTMQGEQEHVDNNFSGLVTGAYRTNGVVFACMLARQLLFSEARFQFRQVRSGRPGDLFGTSELSILERPEPGKTTGDLLTRAIQDVDLAGNFFAYRHNGRIIRLRPDWVTIVIGSRNGGRAEFGDLDAEVAGYLYHPGGQASGRDTVVLRPELVAHFAPIPDPLAGWRGMSWLVPVIREIMGDSAASSHKLRFFENAATPNMAVTLEPNMDPEKARQWVEIFKKGQEGLENAYKTLFLGGGASAEVIGANLRQMDFKQVQGAGETRIAAAAGVPPIIVGLSEGLQAATYSNYGQARRRFADGTMRPLWRNIAGSLASIITVPPGSELWYDDRDIPFLQEDVQDAVTILVGQMSAIEQGLRSGFEPDAVIDAVTAGDLERLRGKHTGLQSVQLQPPAAATEASEEGRGLEMLAQYTKWRAER